MLGCWSELDDLEAGKKAEIGTGILLLAGHGSSELKAPTRTLAIGMQVGNEYLRFS